MRMNLLLDTGIWWRYVTNGPLNPKAANLIEDSSNRIHLSPLSFFEIVYKVRQKRMAPPPDRDWEEQIIQGYAPVPVTMKACRVAADWDWDHGDPIDRLLAALAVTENLTLLHSDSKLKNFAGFPQIYIKNVLPTGGRAGWRR